MTGSATKKFMVLYLVPSAVLEQWSRTDPETKKAAEAKMQLEWKAWMASNASMILSTEVGGKTKRVTAEGTSDFKNEIMLYSFVEAESQDVAAKAYEKHPHLQIPQSSIEVMEVRSMGTN